MVITRERYARRRDNVLERALKNADFDALCVTDPLNVQYLTGLTEGCRHLMLSRDGDIMLTTVMFHERVRSECPDMEQARIAEPVMESVQAVTRKRGWKRIALIGSSITVAEWNQWCDALEERNVIIIPDVVADCRAVKDAAEIELIRQAIALAEQAFSEFLGRGRSYFVGTPERELALDLEMLVRRRGADDQAFENGIILASGLNSHKAHYVPADRTIQQGDMILIDWGAKVGGYCSDLTRVVATGDVSEELQTMHSVVKQAHLEAVASMKPGVVASEVDAVARRVIADSGYPPEAFRHGLGHSLGLEVHEMPRLSKGSTTALKPGMVLTVEPGVYFENIGGVRLERDILVTENGAEDMGSLALDWFVVE